MSDEKFLIATQENINSFANRHDLEDMSFKEFIQRINDNQQCDIIQLDENITIPEFPKERKANFSNTRFTAKNIKFPKQFYADNLANADFQGLDLTDTEIITSHINFANFSRCEYLLLNLSAQVIIGTRFDNATLQRDQVSFANYCIGINVTNCEHYYFAPWCKILNNENAYLNIGFSGSQGTYQGLIANEKLLKVINIHDLERIYKDDKYQTLLKDFDFPPSSNELNEFIREAKKTKRRSQEHNKEHKTKPQSNIALKLILSIIFSPALLVILIVQLALSLVASLTLSIPYAIFKGMQYFCCPEQEEIQNHHTPISKGKNNLLYQEEEVRLKVKDKSQSKKKIDTGRITGTNSLKSL